MIITRKSPLTGKINEMDLPVTLSQLAAHATGRHLIQSVFPHLNADEREFILTGHTAEDWAVLFPPEEEEVEHKVDFQYHRLGYD